MVGISNRGLCFIEYQIECDYANGVLGSFGGKVSFLCLLQLKHDHNLFSSLGL